MQISDLMSRKVETVTPSDSLRRAANAMRDGNLGALPVGEGDKLVGMITDRDIAIRGIAAGSDPDATVGEIMSREIKYCFQDDDATHVAVNMGELQVRRLPVMNREKRLVGIVALADLTNAGAVPEAAKALQDISQPGGHRGPADIVAFPDSARLRDPGLTVGSIMSRSPVICHVDHSLTEVAYRMREADVGFVFAVDGDELVGAVSDRDLVTRGFAEATPPTVGNVMTRHIIWCREDASLEAAAQLVAMERVRRLAVVNRQNELIGVVCLGDLARAGATDSVSIALREISRPLTTAKMPRAEDPTGGRARKSPAGAPHNYGPQPRLRRGAGRE